MTIASTRFCAVLSASLVPCLAGPAAWASDRAETTTTVTLVPAATVTVVNDVINNTALRTLLTTTAAAPVAVMFTAARAGPVMVNATGGEAGAAVPELVALSGSLTGATINGDAVSVTVDDVSGGSAADSGRVPMVIAQYN